jgi:hypothetical protein
VPRSAVRMADEAGSQGRLFGCWAFNLSGPSSREPIRRLLNRAWKEWRDRLQRQKRRAMEHCSAPLTRL